MNKIHSVWRCYCTPKELDGAIGFLELCGYKIFPALKRESRISKNQMLHYDGIDISRCPLDYNCNIEIIFKNVQELIDRHIKQHE